MAEVKFLTKDEINQKLKLLEHQERQGLEMTLKARGAIECFQFILANYALMEVEEKKEDQE